MAASDDSLIPESGAVFTFGKSRFADNLLNKFWVKNDRVVQIACGDEHTGLVAESGRVFMFGPNNWGQLGLGEENKEVNKPSCVKMLKPEKSKLIACGRSHTIVSTESGNLFSFGSNAEGQLGVPDVSNLYMPKHIESLEPANYKMLAAGAYCSIALTEEGKVFVWGGNEDGELGAGDEKKLETPVPLEMAQPVICIACGSSHSALVTDDGKLYTMGEDEGGKLGLPEDTDVTNVPQEVPGIPDPVKWVACGSSHTVALTEPGDIYVFGEGLNGQLGLGTQELVVSVPTHLKLPFKVSQVFCGETFTALVSEKGQLYTFGDGRHGKLAHGNDQFSNQFRPFHCKRFSKFSIDKVACGAVHMIVTAKPKLSVGENEEIEGDMDEMQQAEDKQEITAPITNGGSPQLSRTLSARERRRNEVSRSFSEMSQLNQTLPVLHRPSKANPLSATMPPIKPKHKVNGEAHREQDKLSTTLNGHKDSGADDEGEEKELKKSDSRRPLISPRRPRQVPRHLPAKEDPNRDDGGSEGDDEEEEDEVKEKDAKKAEEKEEGQKEEVPESTNDEEKEILQLTSELEKKLESSDEESEEELKEDNTELIEKPREEGEEDEWSKDEEEKGENLSSPQRKMPIPAPRKKEEKEEEEQNDDEEEDKSEKEARKDEAEEVKEEKKEKGKKDKKDKKDKKKDEKEDEEEEDEGEEDKKKKQDKKDKDKKKNKDKKKDDEEEEENEESKSEKKDKKKDKKDKTKDKKKKGKKEEKHEDENKENEEEKEDEEKDKKKDKEKDKKKDEDKKDKKKDKDEEEDEDEEDKKDDEEDDKKGKDKKKDKKGKDKKKGKDQKDKDNKDENQNNEKPPKKSRTCTVL